MREMKIMYPGDPGFDDQMAKGQVMSGMDLELGNNDEGGQPSRTVPQNDQGSVILLTAPALLKLLEYAREEAKTDVDLCRLVESLMELKGQLKTKDVASLLPKERD